MKNTYRKIIRTCAILLFLCSCLTVSYAQNKKAVVVHDKDIEYLKLKDFLNLRINPASFHLGTLGDYSVVEGGYNFTDGDFYRPQQAKEIRNVYLYSEGIKNYKGFFFKGSFKYENIREKDKRWSSVFNTYSNNPYSLIDSVGGEWYKEAFTLNGIVSKAITDKLTLGIDLSCYVATGSRQKDPRPDTKLNYIEVHPGISYKLCDNSQLGLSAYYRHYREDVEITNILKVHTGKDSYKAIATRGFGYVSSIALSTLRFASNREYKDNYRGIEGEYLYEKDNLSFIASYKYQNWRSKAERYKYDQLFLMQEGRYDEDMHQARLGANIQSGKLFHSLSAIYTFKTGAGEDPDLLTDVHYMDETDFSFFYSFYKEKDVNQPNWGINCSFNYNERELEQIAAETYQKISGMTVSLGAEKNFFLDNPLINFKTKINSGYFTAIDDESQFDYLTKPTEQFIIPDYNYLTSDKLNLSATAELRFKLKEKNNYLWRLQISYLNSKPIDSDLEGKRNYFDVKLGVLF